MNLGDTALEGFGCEPARSLQALSIVGRSPGRGVNVDEVLLVAEGLTLDPVVDDTVEELDTADTSLEGEPNAALPVVRLHRYLACASRAMTVHPLTDIILYYTWCVKSHLMK